MRVHLERVPHELLHPRDMLQRYSLRPSPYQFHVFFLGLRVHLFLRLEKKTDLVEPGQVAVKLLRVYLGIHAKCLGKLIFSFFHKYPSLHLPSFLCCSSSQSPSYMHLRLRSARLLHISMSCTSMPAVLHIAIDRRLRLPAARPAYFPGLEAIPFFM